MSVTFEIIINGYLDNQWSDWFSGMEIIYNDRGETILRGPVADQAALHGLLIKIRDLSLTLISVNPIDDPKGNPPQDAQGGSPLDRI
jgi:hypothetical protein